jgi:hypothetical protein
MRWYLLLLLLMLLWPRLRELQRRLFHAVGDCKHEA